MNLVVPTEPINDTERRYPRSLAEAFADERAPAMEVPLKWPAAWVWSQRIVYALALGFGMACFMGVLR